MNSRQPTHTPYDGSSRLFTIGLKPLELDKWIEVDGHLIDHLAEKRRLYAEIPGKVFVEEDGTRDAQREVRDLIEAHLLATFPETYRRASAGIEVIGAEGSRADVFSDAPLVAASLLVQEDLILMRQDETGWRLAAGSLCFPSSWSLTEKFGRPLQDIHHRCRASGRARGRPSSSTACSMVCQGQPVERFNWSIQANNALYHPLSNVARIDRATNRPSKFPDIDVNAHAFIRVERQTLRRLPVSRDILFTIRIHLDPLAVLARHPDRATLCRIFATIAGAGCGSTGLQRLTADRDRLIESSLTAWPMLPSGRLALFAGL